MGVNQNIEEPQEEELYEHYNVTASKGQEPLRVDKFLMNFIENATRNKIQKAAKDGNIWVNNAIVKQNYKVKAGDQVRVLFAHPPYEFLLTPENIPLDIVYEDDALLVVNKPAGMVVHPGHGNYSGTLINALVYHFENLPNNSSERPGLVHRIDKDTSGLLVVAKTEIAMAHLSKQFFNKTSEREYIALVWGNVTDDEGTIEGHMARHPKNRLQMTVFPEGDEGKEAITHYKVIERLGYVTLVSCKYGGDRILKGTTFTKYKQFVDNAFKILPRQALHAKTLGFKHPVTGEFMQFNSELPEDIANCIEKWRNYAKHSN